MKRCFGILGWLGVVLVLAALALKVLKPDAERPPEAGARGPRGHRTLRAQPVARHRPIVLRIATSSTDRSRSAACWSFLAILAAINWIGNRQNKRWDLTEAGQFSMSDQTKKIVSELKHAGRRARVLRRT